MAGFKNVCHLNCPKMRTGDKNVLAQESKTLSPSDLKVQPEMYVVVKGQISSRESKNLSVYLFCYEDDNQELGTVELFKRSPTQECKRS